MFTGHSQLIPTTAAHVSGTGLPTFAYRPACVGFPGAPSSLWHCSTTPTFLLAPTDLQSDRSIFSYSVQRNLKNADCMSTPTKGEPPRAPRSMMQQQQSRSTSTGGKRGESAERSSSGTRGPQVTSEKSKNSLAKVPCKFFRAGACSNESCPFLHQEQGTPKQICPWYQTQSCKFGASAFPLF